MARHSQNPVFSMILNDFDQIFAQMARHYFQLDTARRASLIFYQELARAIENHLHSVEDVVKKAMEQSVSIWQEISDHQQSWRLWGRPLKGAGPRFAGDR